MEPVADTREPLNWLSSTHTEVATIKAEVLLKLGICNHDSVLLVSGHTDLQPGVCG